MKKTNNFVSLRGVITSRVELVTSYGAENIYKFYLSVPRTSGNTDVVPVHVSSDVVIKKQLDFAPGMYVQVKGEYRSRNSEGKLILYVLAKDIIKPENMDVKENNNHISLTGFVCKRKSMRTTPKGKHILDVLIAVNRSNNKSSYIPCVIWDKRAETLDSTLKVGDKITLTGRIQSRAYNKVEEDTTITKTAYEVSVGDLKVV